jgi:5'-3' exonuclease
MVGNDFLPHIPSIEIIEDGLELMIEIYRSVGTVGGHLTQTDACGRVSFRSYPLRIFLETIGHHEKPNFEKKLKKKKSFFPDPLLLKHANNDSRGNWFLDLDAYTDDYNVQSFKMDGQKLDMKNVSHQYIQGLCWVITYYTTGCPSWKWYFPYQYAPTARTLAEHVETFVSCDYGVTKPSEPFQQLLSVLPPKSAHLLPKPLDELLTEKTSELVKFCPEKLVIDLAGKRKEWEGITLLPMVDQSLVERVLKSRIVDVVDIDMLRNIPGMIIMYD